MKKIFYWAVGAVFALTGCTEEEAIVNSAEQHDTIQATLEQGGPSSRMLIKVDDNSLTWEKDDAFKVFTADGTKASIWDLKDEDEGKSTGTFEGTQEGVELAGAIYPASIAETAPSNQKLNVTLPSTIVYTGNNLDAPMWASVSSWDESIAFRHLCALLKVNLQGAPSKYVKLKVDSRPSMSGSFVFDTTQDLTSEDHGLVPASSEAGSVTVDFSGDDLLTEQDPWFFIPMPVGVYDYVKISLVDGDGTEKVLNEWYNRTITRAKVYRTSLTYKEIDATTPSEVSSQISSSVSEENKSVTLTMTNVIEATEGNNTITIPAVENTTLVFEQTPNTSGAPLVIAENENSSSTTEKLEISAPAESAALENLVIDTPNATVTLKEGNYGTVTATTAANTMIIEEGVVVKNLVIEGGNVIVRGKIEESVTRDAANKDSETMVNVALASASVPSVSDEKIVMINPFAWYQSDASTLNIATRSDLVSFMTAVYNLSDFSGKTVLLNNDIDMQECELDVQGMIFNSGNFAYFMGTFDGQGNTIKNLKLNYVPSEDNDVTTFNNVFVGLIPAALSAVIKNVTLENGTVTAPGISPDNDCVHVGLLTGYARAIDVINCHNVNSEVLSAAPGYIGGLIGSTGANSGVYTNIIACSNSGTVVSTYTGDELISAGGIYGYGWGKYSSVVACYNLGSVSISTSNKYCYVGGVVGSFGGGNYMYGCFNHSEVTGINAGDLMGETSYSSSVYNSCYMGSTFKGTSVGEPYTDEVRQLSYTDAVKVLNTGIEYYNTLGIVPCEYRFVAGNTPALELAGETGDGTGTPGLGEGEDL